MSWRIEPGSLKSPFIIAHRGDSSAAIEEFRKSEKSWPTLASTDQLERARSYLQVQQSCELPQASRLKLTRLLVKTWQKGKRILSVH